MTKTLTFASMHFFIAFTVAYVMTGSLLVGGAVAAVEPAVNTIAFFFHERLWSRIEAARAVSVGTSPAAMTDLCA